MMHQPCDAPVLGAGWWLHIVVDFGNVDPARVAAEAQDVGAAGLVVHSIGTARPALSWIARAGAHLGGLELAVGIGSLGPDRWQGAFAQPIVDARRAGFRVIPDWEKAWDKPQGRPNAVRVVDHVLEADEGAVGFVADNPWWAPLFFWRRRRDGTLRKAPTHPHAPTREFGRLCVTRYIQGYPLVGENGLQRDGAAAELLAWARDPSQYPACGTPATSVFGTFRGYARSTHDACTLALAEPHQVLYLGSRRGAPNALTPEVRRGLLAAARIRAHGSATVADYQRAAGLVPDGIVGPRTLAALGVRA